MSFEKPLGRPRVGLTSRLEVRKAKCWNQERCHHQCGAWADTLLQRSLSGLKVGRSLISCILVCILHQDRPRTDDVSVAVGILYVHEPGRRVVHGTETGRRMKSVEGVGSDALASMFTLAGRWNNIHRCSTASQHIHCWR